MHEVERVCGFLSALYVHCMHPHSTNLSDTQGNAQTYQIDGDQKKVRSSDTAVNSAFIGGLLVLSRFPLRSPPPVFALLVMMFGPTDASCCKNSNCATNWCQGGSFPRSCGWAKFGVGHDKRADGQTARHSGWLSTPDYNSCQARDGRCAAHPTLSHRSVRVPHHPHFTLSCPDVASADQDSSQTAIRVARTRTANQAVATAMSQ